MKLIYFTQDKNSYCTPGVKVGSEIVDLSNINVTSFSDAIEHAVTDRRAFETAVDEASDEYSTIAIEDVELCAPVGDSSRVICLGGVFPSHLRDRGDDINMVPSQWLVPEPAVIGPGTPIRLPDRVEPNTRPAVELGVVIGTGGRYIRQQEAYDHIAGYTIVNDVTARTDWPGPMAYKLMDTFSPCGPHVVTADTIQDPHNLSMSIRQDEDTICRGSTSGMRFTIPYLVSFLSTILPLKPGDVISTGDPAGVKKSLKVGSTVHLEIDGIGTLSNPVKSTNS